MIGEKIKIDTVLDFFQKLNLEEIKLYEGSIDLNSSTISINGIFDKELLEDMIGCQVLKTKMAAVSYLEKNGISEDSVTEMENSIKRFSEEVISILDGKEIKFHEKTLDIENLKKYQSQNLLIRDGFKSKNEFVLFLNEKLEKSLNPNSCINEADRRLSMVFPILANPQRKIISENNLHKLNSKMELYKLVKIISSRGTNQKEAHFYLKMLIIGQIPGVHICFDKRSTFQSYLNFITEKKFVENKSWDWNFFQRIVRFEHLEHLGREKWKIISVNLPKAYPTTLAKKIRW